MPSDFTFVNNVQNLNFKYSTTLPAGTYEELAYSANPMKETKYLRLDRSEGIKNGVTYDHTTTFCLGSARCQIIVTLKGTATSSDMTVQLVVNNLGAVVQTQAVTDKGTFWLNGEITLVAFNTLPLPFVGGISRNLGAFETYDDISVFMKPI